MFIFLRPIFVTGVEHRYTKSIHGIVHVLILLTIAHRQQLTVVYSVRVYNKWCIIPPSRTLNTRLYTFITDVYWCRRTCHSSNISPYIRYSQFIYLSFNFLHPTLYTHAWTLLYIHFRCLTSFSIWSIPKAGVYTNKSRILWGRASSGLSANVNNIIYFPMGK